jgi:hypothetical protein
MWNGSEKRKLTNGKLSPSLHRAVLGIAFTVESWMVTMWNGSEKKKKKLTNDNSISLSAELSFGSCLLDLWLSRSHLFTERCKRK